MVDPALFPALEPLLAVARTGSVGAAARQRHITSSAVSQQIRRLEAHFDTKLFERAGRGVRLTAAGEAALPVVRELWSGAEGAFGPLAGPAGRPATTPRLAPGRARRRGSGDRDRPGDAAGPGGSPPVRPAVRVGGAAPRAAGS